MCWDNSYWEITSDQLPWITHAGIRLLTTPHSSLFSLPLKYSTSWWKPGVYLFPLTGPGTPSTICRKTNRDAGLGWSMERPNANIIKEPQRVSVKGQGPFFLSPLKGNTPKCILLLTIKAIIRSLLIGYARAKPRRYVCLFFFFFLLLYICYLNPAPRWYFIQGQLYPFHLSLSTSHSRTIIIVLIFLLSFIERFFHSDDINASAYF